ncbi:hypothetical protein GGX14DRAFT_538911 [Mycena pura]|uniref:Uncharacterized protein n=1 Tax=Mycena pura TaxID=153505 RepID=A0AAD7E4X0_9AGAR|nr:hypothetical protein GGX14DRAFT_538911 [Mycena pura]
MYTRIFTSSVFLRRARPCTLHHANLVRRTLFGLGPKPQPPVAGNAALDEENANKMQELFQDKPDAVRAIVNFARVMEDSGVSVSSGQMPGPMQLFKLAKDPKFQDAYRQVETELAKAGIDIRSKEFLDVAKQLYNNYNSGAK